MKANMAKKKVYDNLIFKVDAKMGEKIMVMLNKELVLKTGKRRQIEKHNFYDRGKEEKKEERKKCGKWRRYGRRRYGGDEEEMKRQTTLADFEFI
jgi:hypothetical protein